jgi:hypothetical protein
MPRSKTFFVLQTDDVYVYDLEKHAPPRRRGDPQQEDGATWWDLVRRDDAVAMRDRVLAAFPGSGARVYEYPPGATDDGYGDWRPSVDGLTLVRDWDVIEIEVA